MSPQIERPKPPYRQVADYLREQITKGRFREGQAVPSERQLADEWGISRATATKALASLRAEGLVESTIGVGTTVTAASAAVQEDGQRVSWTLAERIWNIKRARQMRSTTERSEITVTGPCIPPEEVRIALGLDHDKEAVARSRTIYDQSTPIELATSWFSSEIADKCPALRTPDSIEQGTVQYVADQLNVRAAVAQETLSAELAEADDLQRLGLEPPAAILKAQILILTQQSDKLSFEVMKYPASYALTNEWTLPGQDS